MMIKCVWMSVSNCVWMCCLLGVLCSCGEEPRQSMYDRSYRQSTPSSIPVIIIHKNLDEEAQRARQTTGDAGADVNVNSTAPAGVENTVVTQPVQIAIQTSMGLISIEVYADVSPITVDNFLRYIDESFYTNTTFHRVIPGFMIQGGGMELTGDGRYTLKATRPQIVNEAGNGVRNMRGTVAMARQTGADTASSQFFINLVNNVHLDKSSRGAGYAVFGKVVSGMKVVDAIAKVQAQRTVPVTPVKIISVQRK